MAAECCSSCEYQRTVGYPSTSWASCSRSSHCSHSHSGSVINGVVIRDLRFADDIAVLSDNVFDLQVTVDCIAETAKNLGMRY